MRAAGRLLLAAHRRCPVEDRARAASATAMELGAQAERQRWAEWIRRLLADLEAEPVDEPGSASVNTLPERAGDLAADELRCYFAGLTDTETGLPPSLRGRLLAAFLRGVADRDREGGSS